MPDYAEVTAARPNGSFSTFGEKIEEPLSPAPYATTTLLPPRNKEHVSIVLLQDYILLILLSLCVGHSLYNEYHGSVARSYMANTTTDAQRCKIVQCILVVLQSASLLPIKLEVLPLLFCQVYCHFTHCQLTAI